MRRYLVYVLAALAAGASARGSSPDWAKPYLKAPVPRGGYISVDDPWIVVHSEVAVSSLQGGGLRRSYRQVLAPNGTEPRRLAVAVEYNEATQMLSEPGVWVPGGVGYKKVRLQKAAKDAPALAPAYITSDRLLFVTTEEIDPTAKVILAWQVDDRGAFPGEEMLHPPDLYPAAEWTLSVEGGSRSQTLDAFLTEPAIGTPARVRKIEEGNLTLRDVPALAKIYDPHDPWLAHPLQALPAVLISSRPADVSERTWEGMASAYHSLVQDVVASDSERSWVDVARSLTGPIGAAREKVARLAGFTQSLTYRNIEWGAGAYVPETPSETIRTRSGDCKAKTLLLKTLLAEAGVRSVPVLCSHQKRYLGSLPVPTYLGFNHMVLAIEMPGGPDLPAALLEGPGRGWILFDPTNLLNALGRPPSGLEGSPALWIDPDVGGLFTIRTAAKGAERVDARLDLTLSENGEAGFRLALDGESDVAAAMIATRTPPEYRSQARGVIQELLGLAAPGLEVTEGSLQLPDHVAGAGPRIQVAGRIPNSLQGLSGGTYVFSAPPSIVGLVLGLPRTGLRRGSPAASPPPERTSSMWQVEPCCQGTNVFMSGEIRLTLPAGWSIMAAPSLSPLDSPWVKAAVEVDAGWKVSAEIRSGRFPPGSSDERLNHLNVLSSLFRQPFLLSGGPLAGTGRRSSPPVP